LFFLFEQRHFHLLQLGNSLRRFIVLANNRSCYAFPEAALLLFLDFFIIFHHYLSILMRHGEAQFPSQVIPSTMLNGNCQVSKPIQLFLAAATATSPSLIGRRFQTVDGK